MRLAQRLDQAGIKGFPRQRPEARIGRHLHLRCGSDCRDHTVAQHERAAFDHLSGGDDDPRAGDRVNAGTRLAQSLNRDRRYLRFGTESPQRHNDWQADP